MINIPKLQLSPVPEANKLEKLANLIGSKQPRSSLIPENFRLPKNRRLRPVDEIFNDIESGKFQNIIDIEWIVCLHEKEKWDQNNPRRERFTARNIWRASQNLPWLKLRLFWGTALYWSHQQNGVSRSIAENISAFTPQDYQDELTRDILIILCNPQPEKEIAKLSYKRNLSPRQLFQAVDLPQEIDVSKNALNFIADLFLNNDNDNTDVLLACLHEMSQQQELETVEKLLLGMPSSRSKNFSQLADWIKGRYSPRIPKSRWHKLSGKAKENLRKWIGMANYEDFSQLVDRVLEQMDLHPTESNRLRSRCTFWSNYSDRFERIRILLPQSTINRLGSYLNDRDYLKLEDDGSQETEVCIFDFEKWFVIEFFRGKGSETRIVANNHNLDDQLFESKTLSVKRLRYWADCERHDHVYCWQSSCEPWLRHRGILPNEGLTNFKINDKRIEPYNPNIGLPAPEDEQLYDRDQQLQQWEQTIAQLEQEAKVYCLNNP
ncbi:EH signature domain-containing protein [Lyngbya sp. CCY1209]|uniref:EH signature domain-containing protein n=1 Tax=Lyngbya sp. CCY1209 TaxID=2886103 RepID=UPI002D216AC6|nr:EH signature domain-containing protein [Lyngbya sp. CCY1209]MEB3887112.1 EH signature domain-containing protein [Lyngbya sp. CCY1209]